MHMLRHRKRGKWLKHRMRRRRRNRKSMKKQHHNGRRKGHLRNAQRRRRRKISANDINIDSPGHPLAVPKRRRHKKKYAISHTVLDQKK